MLRISHRLLWIMLALAPATALAQDYFGAIAYSPSSRANGWSYDYSSRGEAEQRALSECRGRANDCTVILWFKNACGALATGPNGYGSGWGADRSLAESWALKSCGKHTTGCTVRRWVCTKR